MLDTIALTLNHQEFDVINFDAFSPSAKGLFQPPYYPLGARGNFSCVQNPTKAEFEKGIYKPRLTLTKRKGQLGFSITLRIEFSAPKLIFGNNFDELVEDDFKKILSTLHCRLGEMGIHVQYETLKNAGVSAIHYSKNIALTDYTSCSMVIGELGKINLNQRLDLSKTDYRNEGHSIRYHANSFEITFYDKIKDLEQSKISDKRAFEDDNLIQQNLFEQKNYPKQFGVLRMEVRLGNRTKIKAMLVMLGIQADATIYALFKLDISQKILRHFWQKSTQDMPLLALSQFKPEDMLYAMVAESKGQKKPAKLLQQIGGLMLIRSIGLRGIKVLLERNCTARTWQRMKKELEGLDIMANMKYNAMRNVGAALDQFEPLKLAVFRAGNPQAKGL